MTMQETIRMAFHNVTLNRKRNGLAMLGIVIGITGVLIMGIVGSSGKKMIFEEIKTFGLQTVWVYRDFQGNKPGQEGGSGIRLSDLSLLTNHPRWIRAAAAVIERSEWVNQGGKAVLAQALYTEPDYFGIENDRLLGGRLWTKQEADLSTRVCVIGQDIALSLFGTSSAFGQTIAVADTTYTVIGVLAKKDRDLLKSIGVGNGHNPNGRVIMPISQALTRTDDVDYIQLAAVTTEASSQAAQEAIQLLNRQHYGQFHYTHMAMKNYIDSFDRISRIVSLVLGCAVTISLIIGGIGIANVMTIAVVERTREIGIRKAVGATSQDIFRLFLIEAIILTSSAGIIGVVLGSMVALLGKWIFPQSFDFPLIFIGLGLGVSVVTGILSGVLPAMHAANKTPTEALRYE